MEFSSIITAVAVLLVCALSVRQRVRVKMLRADTPVESKPSIVSQALMELVAVAGGIYIALMALTAFLGMDLPDRVKFIGVEVDPLAAISLIISLVLPFFAQGAETRSRRARRI